MANLIHWGKVYISSYFGVGVTSNTISWGKIYRDLVSIAVSLLTALKDRSTYYENEAGTLVILNEINECQLLEKASILITPTAYSDNVLASAKPEDGTADLDFVRGSLATRTNASNNVVASQGNNVPRIDYTGGEGHVLLEGQATQLYENTETLSTQNNTTTAQDYSVSFYGTGTVTLSGAFSGSLVGTGINKRVSLKFTSTAATLTSTISGTVTKGQLEAGNATSYIPNTTGTTTRLKETLSKGGLSSLINSAEGVFYLNFSANLLSGFPLDLTIRKDNDNRITFFQDGNLIKLAIRSGAVNVKTVSVGTVSIGQNNRIAISWIGSSISIYLNGEEINSSTVSSMPSDLKEMIVSDGNRNYNFKCIAVFKETLTSAELQCLTTIPPSFLLEDGGYLLQENGSKIIL